MIDPNGFFDFSKREQIGVMAMVALILVLILLINTHQFIWPPEQTYRDRPDIEQALLRMQVQDTLQDITAFEKKPRSNRSLPEPFFFDPNQLSASGYEKLGFSERQSASIRKYLDRGGRIRNEGDFKKLYVVNDFMYDRLKDFIRIEEDTSDDIPDIDKGSIERNEKQMLGADEISVVEEFEGPWDINSADSITLEALPGIGPIYTQRILKYRSLLGSYHDLDQLHEVYGLDKNPHIVDIIRPHLFIGHRSPHIDVNMADWGTLVRHPYIDKQKASAIVNYREQHGPYEALIDLTRSHLIDSMWVEGLSPYLFTE